MLKWLLSSLVLFTIAACLAPEQTTPKGVWVVSADDQTASVSGRVTQQIWKKLNPVWWFLNDDEPDPPDWQLPGKPYLIRQLSWYARNPLQNFGKYVIGVSDRNYTVTVRRARLYDQLVACGARPNRLEDLDDSPRLAASSLCQLRERTRPLVRRMAMVRLLRL